MRDVSVKPQTKLLIWPNLALNSGSGHQNFQEREGKGTTATGRAVPSVGM